MRAWPVRAKAKPVLLDVTKNHVQSILFTFEGRHNDLHTYTNPNKQRKLHLEWATKRELSRTDKNPLAGVLNQELLLLQSEQDQHLWNAHMTQKSRSSSRSRSRTPISKLDVDTADSVYFDTYLKKKYDMNHALEALDALCLHTEVHARSCLLCSALPGVLRENKNLIETKRNGYFGSFMKSGKYIQDNEKARHMIQFWQNLYYQFGLLALELNAALLRPPNSILWSNQCKTISAYGFHNLYKDHADFVRRGKINLQMYQSHYNERHGMLRWFQDTSANTNLHIDITDLNAILTRYFARNFEKVKDRVQHALLNEVFALENNESSSITEVVTNLVQATGKNNYQACPQQHYKAYKEEEQKWYDAAFDWRWHVLNDEVYNKIYEEAGKRSEKERQKQAKSMSYVLAVEHHRRYKQRTGPSIFWRASTGLTYS